MSYLHGRSVLFASPLVTATNHLFDVNTGCSAIQHLTKSATFAVIRLQNEAVSHLHRLSVLFASPIVTVTNRLFDVNTGYSAIPHLTKSATFAVIRLKNEAMSYLHGLSVLFSSPLVSATNWRLCDVNTRYSAIQHLAKSATFAVIRLKNEVMSYLHGLSVSFALRLV